MTAGVLDREEDPDDEEEEEGGEVPECKGEVPESEAEDSESSAGLRGGRLRRSWRKVWNKISGKSARRRTDGKHNNNNNNIACLLGTSNYIRFFYNSYTR